MVDAADQEKIEASKNELHNLLDKPQLQGIPVSSLGGWEGSGWSRRVAEGVVGGQDPGHSPLDSGLLCLLCRS